MSKELVERIAELKKSITPGPWQCGAMDMPLDKIGEYVQGCVDVGPLNDFYFILCQKEDGPADVCHVGNGPTSEHNAALIALAPEMADLIEKQNRLLGLYRRLRVLFSVTYESKEYREVLKQIKKEETL